MLYCLLQQSHLYTISLHKYCRFAYTIGWIFPRSSLFEAKYTSFSCSTIDSSRNNPRALWRAIRQLTEPPQQSPTAKLTAHDFATFFMIRSPPFGNLQLHIHCLPYSHAMWLSCHTSIHSRTVKSSHCWCLCPRLHVHWIPYILGS